MPNTKTRHHFFIAFLVISGVLFFFTFKPHANAIILGAALAALSHPIYLLLHKKINYKSLAAFITILILLAIVLVPSIFLGIQAIKETQSVYSVLVDNGGFTHILGNFSQLISRYFPYLDSKIIQTDINSFLSGLVQKILENLIPVFSGFVSLVIQIIISLIVCFYLLKDGDSISRFIINTSPLKDSDDSKIIGRVKKTISAVIQGILMGVGFALFNIPNPVLWGGVTMIASLIPGIGTAIITIPSFTFLIYQNQTLSAILILVWGIIIVGLVDNILRPHLIKKDIKIHQFLILLSVLGGLKVFGPIGLILGPLTLSLFFALLDVYDEII